MTRKVNQAGIKLIQQWEGLRLRAYRCSANILTIGYGHTSAAGAPQVVSNMTITKAEADAILKRDLAQFEQAVDDTIIVALNDNQFAALVSLAFNIGIGNFKRSTLVKKLNKGDYDAVPEELMKWVKATVNGKKVTLQGLVNRRAAEAGLWVKDSFVSSNFEQPVETHENPILKPETLGPLMGAAAGLTGFATGSGPFQWALAAVMVIGALSGVFSFIRRLRAQNT